jgi:hypothetical protein
MHGTQTKGDRDVNIGVDIVSRTAQKFRLQHRDKFQPVQNLSLVILINRDSSGDQFPRQTQIDPTGTDRAYALTVISIHLR